MENLTYMLSLVMVALAAFMLGQVVMYMEIRRVVAQEMRKHQTAQTTAEQGTAESRTPAAPVG